METRRKQRRIPVSLWPVFLVVIVVGALLIAGAAFNGSFTSYIPVMLTSDRSGLVMETGAKVKLHGVEVGKVAEVDGNGLHQVRLRLLLLSDEVKNIPANVGAQIKSTTVFGAKYVDLIYPSKPSLTKIAAGAVLASRNVTVEVNTIFQNLANVLDRVDPAKLNAILAAVAEGVRGQGDRMGEAITDAKEVLDAINPRMETLAQNWRSFKQFNDTYAAAAKNIVSVLDAASTTSSTITDHAKSLDALLINTTGFAISGTDLIAPNRGNLVDAINLLRPTTDLLFKYNPEYTCLLNGAKWFLDHGGYSAVGGNGKSVILDAALLFGADPYKYPDNLPIVNAKGGPGGKPGCGSLPDATKNFPVRQLVTDTGFGTGLDWRPNPGIGFPGWTNYFPVTRGTPEPPVIRNVQGGPAPGPIPYPGAPPFNAPENLPPPPPAAPAPPADQPPKP